MAGKMTIKTKILQLILIVLVLMNSPVAKSQQIDISIRSFPSSWYNSFFEPAIDGFGLGFAYHHILNKSNRLKISGEFDVLRSRSEVLAGIGINRTIWQAKQFRISIEANILNGIDLYKPSPLYVGGIEAVGRFDFYIKKRVSLFAAIGARATFCPGYRSYGVWKNNSWPLVLGVRF
jgi:hypothetical protein